MHRSLEKVRRRVDSEIAKRKGPARKNQDAAPIADAMSDFWQRSMLTFGVPAHNDGRGPLPEFAQWAGVQAARADLPMSHGVHVAIMAVAGPGETLVMARNGHKSSFAGLVLSGA